MIEPHSVFAHIVAQTRENVQLLIAHKQISVVDGEAILSRLSAHTGRESEGVGSLVGQTTRVSMSPALPKVEARAIWGWTSEDPSDLSFEAGDVIEVVTETNADWWMGRTRSGRQGLFPSNYVAKLPPRSLSPIFVPEPRQSTPSVHVKVEERYGSPALPYPSPHAPPQTHYPPLATYHPPAGSQPVSQVSQPVPQQAVKKGKLGGLGQMMAQSAAGGVGVGAGAAMGGELVSSFF